jgi:hypothetical protein
LVVQSVGGPRVGWWLSSSIGDSAQSFEYSASFCMSCCITGNEHN